MTDEPVSPLRRRMIEDMTIRKLAPKTQEGYVRTVKNFAAFLGRSPDTADGEDVRRSQLHLAASGAQAPILNHAVSALRFFFKVTLKRHDIIEHTIFIREPRKLPVVLSPQQVARLLNAAPGASSPSVLNRPRQRSLDDQKVRSNLRTTVALCGSQSPLLHPQRRSTTP